MGPHPRIGEEGRNIEIGRAARQRQALSVDHGIEMRMQEIVKRHQPFARVAQNSDQAATAGDQLRGVIIVMTREHTLFRQMPGRMAPQRIVPFGMHRPGTEPAGQKIMQRGAAALRDMQEDDPLLPMRQHRSGPAGVMQGSLPEFLGPRDIQDEGRQPGIGHAPAIGRLALGPSPQQRLEHGIDLGTGQGHVTRMLARGRSCCRSHAPWRFRKAGCPSR